MENSMSSASEEQQFGVAVGRIQSDVMHVLVTLTDMKATQVREYGKLDERITNVEKFMWRIAGLVGVFPFVFTAILWVLSKVV
jgi:hypothetical protein